jgi:hypothetical protein
MFSKGQRVVGLAAATMVAALYSVPSLSAVQTWSFSQASQSFTGGTGFGNSLLQSSGGVNLTTTGWSDTTDVTTGSGVDTIQTGALIWANSTALGIQNQDEPVNPSSPHHSVDSVTSGGGDPDGEFEMLLLTFDTAVTLTGIDLNWAQGGGTNKADVSILAWNGSGSSTLSGKTWSNVLASNGGGYDVVGSYAGVGLSYFSIPTSIESTQWLIGVYNPVFGTVAGADSADDGMKLASLTTSTTPPDRDVPVPGTVALILAGLAALRVRGKRKVMVV